MSGFALDSRVQTHYLRRCVYRRVLSMGVPTTAADGIAATYGAISQKRFFFVSSLVASIQSARVIENRPVGRVDVIFGNLIRQGILLCVRASGPASFFFSMPSHRSIYWERFFNSLSECYFSPLLGR